MSPRTRTDDGFGLVEVVIAILLLGIIAMALLPFLAKGIEQSLTQSATATATRELNSLIEEARVEQSCTKINQIRTNSEPYYPGTNREFFVRVPSDGTMDCTVRTAVVVSLEAVHGDDVLTRVDAKVYVVR